MKAIWPEEVPILTAKDFCKGQLDKGAKHCILGWVRAVFRPSIMDQMPGQYEAEIQAKKAIAQVIHVRGWRENGIVAFNDSGTPLTLLAKTWNQAMARIGYTNGNPEV